MSGEVEGLIELFRAALRFMDKAAGEGVIFDSLPAPEDVLGAYAAASGDEDVETYADRLPDALAVRLTEAEAARERLRDAALSAYKAWQADEWGSDALPDVMLDLEAALSPPSTRGSASGEGERGNG